MSWLSHGLHNFGRAATRITGNPLGIPGLDLNMIRHPTDVGHYAPLTKAAAIATAAYFGAGGLGGLGGASPPVGSVAMPAAVPETAGGLSKIGMVETAPGAWEASNAPASAAGKPAWLRYARLGNAGMNLLGGGGGGQSNRSQPAAMQSPALPVGIQNPYYGWPTSPYGR